MARRGLDTIGRVARGLLDLFHYSDEPLEVIDPDKFLTNPNIRGQERELSYGTRLTKMNEQPEVEDIDRFFPIALEEVKDLAAKYDTKLTPIEINRLATNRAMKYAKDFGFLGLSNRKYRPNVYTQFQKVIPMDVSRRDGSVGDLLEYLKKAGK